MDDVTAHAMKYECTYKNIFSIHQHCARTHTHNAWAEFCLGRCRGCLCLSYLNHHEGVLMASQVKTTELHCCISCSNGLERLSCRFIFLIHSIRLPHNFWKVLVSPSQESNSIPASTTTNAVATKPLSWMDLWTSEVAQKFIKVDDI